MMRGLVVDLFAGGGGASTGLEAALERPVDVAVNHSPVAIAVHTANHPATRHLTTDKYCHECWVILTSKKAEVWVFAEKVAFDSLLEQRGGLRKGVVLS